MILLLSLPLGLALGIAIGGSLRALKQFRLRGELVLVALLLMQGLLPLISGSGIGKQVLYWAWALTFPIMAGVCLVNFRVPGMVLAAVGLSLNAAVILMNSGMPVLPEAVAAAGGVAAGIKSTDFAHVLVTAGTRLCVLADVLPMPGPPGVRGVASAGDVLLACGVVACLSSAMFRYASSPGNPEAGSSVLVPK